ncbi:hypothetical protein B9Z55_018092 [Caenorhabditis nigoni]|uniref:Uncharacterized protein n=1 Tax=Caenorhabditis nigoni TaxID=1611254 RepID=A0A2G5TCI5_9PELO|nr:hypothetical protein B9Z55_018092 [Caenorhabditis nigoni]
MQKQKSTKSHQKYLTQENLRQNEAVESAVSYVAVIFLHNNFRLSVAKGIFGLIKKHRKRYSCQFQASKIQQQILLLQAGVPLALTPQEQAAIAAYLATSVATTASTTALTTTTDTTTTDTTTTTATTTTTTPYPCSACSPIYDPACQGLNMPSSSMYCLTDSEVPVAYTRGACPTCGVSDACMLSLGCPSGTASRLDTGSGDVNGNSDGSPTFLYCDETSPSWYAVIDSATQPLSNAACRYP